MIVVDRKTKLTYEDYLQFPDDGRRHEIIDGNHYVSGAPFVPHQRILKKLLIQLCRRIDDTGLGEVLEDAIFRASGEHAEGIDIACTAGRGGQPIRIDLTEIW